MKKMLNNYTNECFQRIEENFHLKLGVGDKYLANKIIQNIFIDKRTTPHIYEILKLQFIPMFSKQDGLDYALFREKYTFQEKIELEIWRSKQ